MPDPAGPPTASAWPELLADDGLAAHRPGPIDLAADDFAGNARRLARLAAEQEGRLWNG